MCFQAIKGMSIAPTALCPLSEEELMTTMKKPPRLNNNQVANIKKGFKNKQQASRSPTAFLTSIHKPVESNNKQPKSLQGALFFGIPRIDHFLNTLRGARAVQVLPLAIKPHAPVSQCTSRTGGRVKQAN